MTRNRLVIFVKEPCAGRVKTRLARGIGTVPAAWWFRHQIARLVRRLGHDARWHTVLAVAPDTAIGTGALPFRVPRIPQGHGDLGARMGRVLRGMPPGRVMIVGGDIPGIQARHVARAFGILGDRDAVIGPAEDGGYWLIGLRRGGRAVPAHLFRDVRWSTGHAMSDTIHSLGDLSVGLAAGLRDVDEARDLPVARVMASPTLIGPPGRRTTGQALLRSSPVS